MTGQLTDTEPWGFAEPYEDIVGEVAIVGVGDADHTSASGRTAKEIAIQAVERALDDAGLRAAEVDGIMYAPYMADQLTEAGLTSAPVLSSILILARAR